MQSAPQNNQLQTAVDDYYKTRNGIFGESPLGSIGLGALAGGAIGGLTRGVGGVAAGVGIGGLAGGLGHLAQDREKQLTLAKLKMQQAAMQPQININQPAAQALMPAKEAKMITAEELLKTAALSSDTGKAGVDFYFNAVKELSESGDTDFFSKTASIMEDAVQLSNQAIEKVASAGSPGLAGKALQGLKAHGADIGKSVAGAALTGLAVSMLNDLATTAHESLTRNRNFKRMMEYAPDLKEHDPKAVKGTFDSLHTLAGPKVTGEPHIAAEFVRTQVQLVGAGGGFSSAKNLNDLVGTRNALDRVNQKITSPQISYSTSSKAEKRTDEHGNTSKTVSRAKDKRINV